MYVAELESPSDPTSGSLIASRYSEGRKSSAQRSRRPASKQAVQTKTPQRGLRTIDADPRSGTKIRTPGSIKSAMREFNNYSELRNTKNTKMTGSELRLSQLIQEYRHENERCTSKINELKEKLNAH
jgi:hypothetical protein